MDVLSVILEVVGILGIIALGTFVVVLVADLILSAFDNHEGIFFRRRKKEKTDKVSDVTMAENLDGATITPYIRAIEPAKCEVDVFKDVDFQKAIEEQKYIQSKIVKEEEIEEEVVVKEEETEPVVEIDEEKELSKAIKETTKIALEQISLEEALKKQKEEFILPLASNALADKAETEQKQDAQVIILSDVAGNNEDENLNSLKKLREDIFTLRRSAFKDLQEAKCNNAQKTLQQNKEEFTERISQKLSELNEVKEDKETLAQEKEELLKYKKVALDKESELEQVEKEKQQLEQEVNKLKELQQTISKPYYTREYYVNKLENLEAELKDVKKELRINRREFSPLRKIKKSYERDSQKLRRKEAIVAKQKVAVYGVKTSGDVNLERKEKLDAEVKLLNELKESVQHCERVLKENKERYPVLEQSNKLLTKTQTRLTDEIETVNAAIAWYDENSSN